MVTQELIARKLGLSRQLVSFALAGHPQVSEASRKRILAAAQELGYKPNPYARALKKGRTGIVALWIQDLFSTHYIHVMSELNRVVKQAKHELIVNEVGSGGAAQMLSHVPVDAIFAMETPLQVSAYVEAQRGQAVPVISMGAACYLKTDYIKVDLDSATKEAMEHLMSSGYKRIAHATFIGKGLPESSRRVSYTKAMRKAGLKPEFIHYPLGADQRASVRRIVQDYVGQNGCPEAIFCHSDDVALGIYRGLCDMKLRVPEDVAIVGCDGIQDTEYLECPITTIVQPVEEMCALAWNFLTKRFDDGTLKQQQITLKPRLAVRESSLRQD
ncbi:transcriptional regulator, LacI family [Pedosphaera parvula Ellin514]|uniref:Transcriptional regulator, LacI family n=2 Tax=Pedosphaera TaxID=1032526 RepID=B9XL29_PEDPL|nr:transcriptional regulator, LacI family [Pedosphaera parvula Ellin514]